MPAPARRWLPLLLSVAAVAMIAASYWQPFWSFKLYAPQYPRGLTLSISLAGFSGDVREIDMLNHYIGMKSLHDGAALERAYSHYAIGGLALAVLVLSFASFVGKRRAAIVAAILGAAYPVGFVADTFYWLYTFGHTLDPRAPLRIPAFTPELFGNGTIGQFMTFAMPQTGFWLSVAAAVVLLVVAVLPVRPPRTGGLFAVLVLAMLGASSEAAARGPVPRGPVEQPGPVARAMPADAHVVRSAQELTRVLADANGPARLWLASGVYAGNFRVTRPLLLAGERGAILDGGGRGTVLELEADDIQIENLTIRGSGRRHTLEDAGVRATGARIALRNLHVAHSLFGITLGSCPACTIERSQVSGDDAATQGDGIKLWESNGAVVRDCIVENMRDMVIWYSRRVLLERNLVRNSRYGSHFMYAHDSIVRDSRISDNVVGIFVMYSARLQVSNNVLAGAKGPAGVGVGFKDSDDIHLTGNWIVANTTGAYLDVLPRGGAPLASFAENLFALNQVALQFHSMPRGMAFTRNEFRSNGELLGVEGGGDALQLSFEHNYYSDYAGFDLDRDGRGDVAHEVLQLSAALVEDRPVLRLFRGTAAMRLLDVIARAAPVFANRVLMRDPLPASEPTWSLP